MGICLSIPKNISKLDERSQLKPKKRKVDKAAIGLPSNFQHLAHGGADGSTSQPGTTKSQFASLKNKMNDFARLLGDFDNSSKDVPSSSSYSPNVSDNKDSSTKKSFPTADTNIEIKNDTSLNSSINKNNATDGTLKTLPTRSKPDSRTSVKELFDNASGNNSLATIDEKKTKASNALTPSGNFSYLELPLEIENNKKPVFSTEDVDALLKNPSEYNQSNDPTINQPESTQPIPTEPKDINIAKTSEESNKETTKPGPLIDIVNQSTSQEKLLS